MKKMVRGMGGGGTFSAMSRAAKVTKAHLEAGTMRTLRGRVRGEDERGKGTKTC